MRYRNLFLILPFLAFSHLSKAQTSITSSIYSSTTWTLAGSPYSIDASVVLFGGATLTIEPGVEVRIKNSTYFEIRGALVAEGTPDKRITFTSASATPTRGIYWGLKVKSQGGSVKMAYCNASYANEFLDLGNASGSYNIHHCAFTNNWYAIGQPASGTTLIVDSCYFENNRYGVGEPGSATGTVRNSLFFNNEYGAQVDAIYNSVFIANREVAANAYNTLMNCEIYNNNTGVIWDGHGNTTIKGNYIHDNTRGVRLERFVNHPAITFAGNKICNNSLWNVDYLMNSNITLNGNCWCSTDSATVRSKICDGYRNPAAGLISFDMGSSCTAGINQPTTTPGPGGSGYTIPDVKVYPNPFLDHITIELSEASNLPLTFLLMDKTGQVVIRVENIKSKVVNVQRDKLPAGLYFYQVRLDKQVLKVGKLIAE